MSAIDEAALGRLARRAVVEDFTLEAVPVAFLPAGGVRREGVAAVDVTRTSIGVRFAAEQQMDVAEAGYEQSNGAIETATRQWNAPRVTDSGLKASGERLFAAPELIIDTQRTEPVAATRLIFAGAQWQARDVVVGRKVVAEALAPEPVTHHEQRLSLAVEGAIDDAVIDAMDRACAFVAGHDLQLLRIDTFCRAGALLHTRHVRRYRRLGRAHHSPFTGISASHRMRAWALLVAAIPELEAQGIPIVEMINHIGAHNMVAEINSSSILLTMSVHMMAYHHMHGHEIVAGAASRRPELAALSQHLDLRLTDDDLDRFERLRIELLDGGFYHKPGYETGRPQKDIKFIRDIAHTIVFRLCGYTGPFYGAQVFATRTL